MFRSVLFVSSVLLMCGLSAAQDPQRQWGPNGIACDFHGPGGQINIFPPGDLGKFISMKFLKLQEIDVNGNVVAQVDGFDTFAFVWASFNHNNQFGAAALEFTIAAPFLAVRSVNQTFPNFFANFQVNSFLFVQNATTTFAGENVPVKAGQVKWQLQLQNWKFQNPANKLQYGIHLISSQAANNTAFKRLDHVPGTIGSFAIGFGVGNIIVPTVAQEDGKNVTITANVNYQGGQLAIVWEFPAFNNSLVYDPVTAASDLVVAATTTTTSGSASEKSVSTLAMMALVVLAMWAVNQSN